MQRLRFSFLAFLLSVLALAVAVDLLAISVLAARAWWECLPIVTTIESHIRHCWPHIASIWTCLALNVCGIAVGLLIPALAIGWRQLKAVNRSLNASYRRCAIVGAYGAPVFAALLAVLPLLKGQSPQFAGVVAALIVFAIAGSAQGIAYRAAAGADTFGNATS